MAISLWLTAVSSPATPTKIILGGVSVAAQTARVASEILPSVTLNPSDLKQAPRMAATDSSGQSTAASLVLTSVPAFIFFLPGLDSIFILSFLTYYTIIFTLFCQGHLPKHQ